MVQRIGEFSLRGVFQGHNGAERCRGEVATLADLLHHALGRVGVADHHDAVLNRDVEV